MTSEVDSSDAAGIPEFPMARAAGCPFDPPRGLYAIQQEGAPARVQLWDGSTPWMVTRHADQRMLLADARVSADPRRPGYPSALPISSDDSGAGFVVKDDPEHARLRRMVTAPFAIKRIEAMRPAVQEIVDKLIDTMLAGPKPVDLVEVFAQPVPSLVICDLLGVPYDDHDFFQLNSKRVVSRDTAPEERREALGRLTDYPDRLVGEKLDTPGDDLLSGLTERIKSGETTRKEAAVTGVLLLVAGHETTANMIALGTLVLLQHPDQFAFLRDTDDPNAVASAVEEMLRYLSIIHDGRRRAVIEDIEFAGRTIRAGEGLILANNIGNRDPEVFPDPDRLDIRRDARRHVAFGFGVHQCLGQPLARMELQVVYSTLAKRIPTLRLATALDKIPFKHDAAVYGVHELPVAW
ncbi:cytochrome P450 [Streptomyces sp. NPDC048251]|uniref:cytochrome P450 n=1 Tax=Streptomyces sp. NPDC048251 TaxID=3154501 RepID=UPI00342E2775